MLYAFVGFNDPSDSSISRNENYSLQRIKITLASIIATMM
jgi:hypothetical protein